MTRTASPRLARLLHYRHNDRGTTLIARITQGPKSELGRNVHVVLTKNNLPVLREVIEKLENTT